MNVQVKTETQDDVFPVNSSNTNENPNDQVERVPSPTEFDSLNAHLQEHPFDTEAWRRFIACAEDSGETKMIRTAYEALLKQYPNSWSAQIAYINHFLNKPNTFKLAEDLFKRFLRGSSSVELMRFYLTYVRRINTDPATRDTVRKAYEFALGLVGQDRDSGDMWADYINFLNAGPADSTWEGQQKMDALRRTYTRAVQIPLDNLEKLWSDYESFETRLNRITAKKFMSDLSPAYMQARAVLRELNKHTPHLFPPASATSPQPGQLFDHHLPTPPSFTMSERQHVGRWKAYLKYEESNPLMMEEKDKANLHSRISLVYRKAVVRMRYFPEIWFMSYSWTSSIGKEEEAASILKSGIEANPASFILNFAYIDLIESKKELEEVHKAYEKFLDVLRENLDVLQAEADKAADGAGLNGDSEADKTEGNKAHNPEDSMASFMVPSSTSSDSVETDELKERKKEYALVWIMYMRFGRRAEGVKSSRAIFGKARRGKYLHWELYEAGALMEYHCSGDKDVATRIFDLGMNLHAKEKDYVLRYLGFLISLNDENNARALFERVINTFPPEQSRALWERWSRYEFQYSDYEAAQKLEKRMMEIFPNDPPIKRFAQRYSYLSIDAIASRDIGVAMAKKEAQLAQLKDKESNRTLGATASLASINGSGNGSSSGSLKRQADDGFGSGPSAGPFSGAGPGRRRGVDGDHGHGNKRQRASSPPPRDRDRDWEGSGGSGRGGRRGRFSSPPGDIPKGRGKHQEPVKDEEKPVQLPSALSWFIGQLPAPNTFDGPVFRTDDLMNLFRNAVIPSTTKPKSPPPPARSGGRPPPDYSPYQGPRSNSRGARY
ncbi:Suf-domain-containing protein [Dendrothele bispora CBS 962.96]|uniref:mRNA 3'-end-processing protein RNA14 n=1 Tax=Dendrothele bispora (strain CBS 962.96) TaxID=1314807 RepID=A0A4S8M8A6_DENBC|nr:Suf-domain-containing protein [Dendrothele bispora CBS 962.96]